ncbi:MAG: iron ABC transporter permease [Polyangiaceae bacterium]|nr:iron ABC transporter permease [Polyangiaceae bacterium]
MSRPARVAAVMAAVLVAAAVMSAATGALGIPLGKAFAILFLEPLGIGSVTSTEYERAVVIGVRAPRIVLGVLVGSALGSCGAAVQGLFKNPLADPGLVGVSAGASLGAAVAIVLGGGALAAMPEWMRPALLPLAAFVGGCVVTAAVLRLGSGLRGVAATMTVLLAGVAMNALAGAMVGMLSYLADDVQLRRLVFWTMGDIEYARWVDVACTAPWIILVLVGLPRLGRTLDLLSLGEREASYLGVRVARVRVLVVGAVALGVGATVAVAGLIGFLGLVVPHLVRLLVGSHNRLVIPISGLAGATLLVVADLLSHLLFTTARPVGLFTVALGAPFFLYLLRKQTRLV